MNTKYPSSWPQELKPSNDDDFVYVEYYSYCSVNGNQSFNLSCTSEVTDNISDIRVLGVRDENGNVYKNDASTSSFTAQITDNDYYVSGRTGYFIRSFIAYPKSSVPAVDPAKTYTLKHKITYSLTSIDDKQVTQSSSTATKGYTPVVYKAPGGHFGIYKTGKNTYYDSSRKTIYGYALNQLRNNESTEASYYVRTEGFGAPWSGVDSNNNGKIDLDELGKRSYTVTSTDDTVKFDGQDTDMSSADMEFASILVQKPYIYDYTQFDDSGYGYYETANGIASGTVDGGSYGYKQNTNNASQPTVIMTANINGTWRQIASMNWRNGTPECSTENGASSTISNGSINITPPSNTIDIKLSVTTSLGAVIYVYKPTIRLKPSAGNLARVSALFDNSDTPETTLLNEAKMVAYDSSNNSIATMRWGGTDYLDGAAIGASMKKELSYSNDTSNRKVDLHYTATVDEQSNILDADEYEKAAIAGAYDKETIGTWYDLLPVGVIPNQNSIALRSNDMPASVKAIENWRGTGRVMLIVKVNLTPSPSYQKRENSITGKEGYHDTPTISFDASITWEALNDYGSRLTNNIVFESGNDSIGNVKGLSGEPDDPTVGNNAGSGPATQGIEKVLTGLDPSRDGVNAFVYASNVTDLVVDTMAVTSLSKAVSVNNDNAYDNGLDNNNPRNVYESGTYSYRLHLQNDDETKSQDVILYDALDAYVPSSDKGDYGDTQWRGTLSRIDTTQLTSAGIKPTIYYSTKKNITLDDTNNRNDLDLTNVNIWSTGMPSDHSSITAVAIDASKKTDGSNFVLDCGQSLSAYVIMKAPRASEVAGANHTQEVYDSSLSDGVSEVGLSGGAHAYNNVTMLATTISSATGAKSENQLVRYDYTKVGLLPYNITIRKQWDDDNNRDGYRPESVKLELLADGKGTGKTVTLDSKNNWAVTITDLDATNNNGELVNYSVREIDLSDKYSVGCRVSRVDDGINIVVTDKHTPEKTTIDVIKSWTDDSSDVRPDSITFGISANGAETTKQILNGSSSSNEWVSSISDLFKYDSGKIIDYSVSEDYVPGYVSSTEIKADDATRDKYTATITNKYSPYADLIIKKNIINATTASKNTPFTFKLTITKPQDGSDSPYYVSSEWDYETSAGVTGTISNGGTLTLRGGETATIKNLPSDTTYQVEETNVPDGWELTTQENTTGTLKAGEQGTATFINTYDSTGKARLQTQKQLSGRNLSVGQFRFVIKDAVTGEIIRTSNNQANGDVTFGALQYGLADNGKTYEYIIQEQNTGSAGYTYDTSTYKAYVTINDNGNGTLNTAITYKDTNNNIIEMPMFKNEYHASGSIELSAWKKLTGDTLNAGQFEFELSDETGKVISTAKNDAPDGADSHTGIIRFASISIDESSVDKTLKYLAREKRGSESGVSYSDLVVTYTVKVKDNGNGTLSFETSTDATPVFVNTVAPGSLAIEKHITDNNDYDPNAEFEFTVKLAGESVPDDGTNITYRRESLGSQYIEDHSYYNSLGYIVQQFFDDLFSIFFPNIAFAASVSSTQIVGECTFTFYDDNSLIIEPTNGTSGELQNNSTTQALFNKATSITIKEGTKAPQNVSYMFRDCSGLSSLDLSGFNTNNVTNMSSMFSGCSGLSSLDLSGWNTSNVTNMRFMFYGCSVLSSLDLSGWNTSNVKYMNNMFRDCSVLSSLDLSGWNTNNVTNMSSMFSGCSGLTSLDLSGFDTSNVTDMSYMFSSCNKINKIYFGIKWKFIGITCSLPTPGSGTTGKWIKSDKTAGPYAQKELYTNWDADTMAGWWIWEMLPTEYIIKWDKNTPNATLSMTDSTWNVGTYGTIPPCGYYSLTERFISWNTKADGTGTTYKSGQKLSTDLAKAGEKVTLYAQWEKLPTSSNIKNGEFKITMRAKERVVIDNLPTGVTYIITETPADKWTLDHSENTTGKIIKNATQTAKFINILSKTESGVSQDTTVSLTAMKTLDNSNNLDSQAFSFSLDVDGKTVQTKKNDSNGVISFDSLIFSDKDTNAVGDHAFRIYENTGTDSSIQYDDHIVTGTISVTKDATNSLHASVKYDSGASVASFNNTHKDGTLIIQKKLDGSYPENALTQDFTFKVVLTSPDGSVTSEDVALHAGGQKTFSLSPGTRYTITETEQPAGYTLTSTSVNGITNKDASSPVEGTITAGIDSTVCFTNSYDANGSVILSGTKTMSDGSILNAGDYQFSLYEINSSTGTEKKIGTVSNAGDGAFAFDALSFKRSDFMKTKNTSGVSVLDGELRYAIREDADTSKHPDVVFDSHATSVTLTAVDNGNGTITIMPKYDNGTVSTSTTKATFTNSMKPGILRITKNVRNGASASKTTNFDFVLSITDDDNTPLSGEYTWSRSDGMTGTVRSGDSIQLCDGQYVDMALPAGSRYSVTEKECSGYMLVEKNGDTGTIEANGKSEASFVNEYNASGVASLQVNKIVAGFELTDKQFTFKAIPVDDSGVSAVKSGLSAYNDANGRVLFDSLLFTTADDGKTFTYDIIECDDEQSNIAYDTSTIQAKISVRDAGDGTMITSVAYTKNDSNVDNPSFTNKKSVTMPVTGSSALLILLLFGVSVYVACAVKIARRKED